MSDAVVVRERPIIFSGPMVKAILAGRKTQTRRVIKPQLPEAGCEFQLAGDQLVGRRRFGGGFEGLAPCPFAVGMRLWVRETWQDYCPIWDGYWCGHGDQAGIVRDHRPVYRADPESLWLRGPEGKQGPPTAWRPASTMPRWASRITLEITGVEVERLQQISEADAIAEGVDSVSMVGVPRQATWSRRQDFAQLWDKINGKQHPWQSNPWCWCIAFRRVEP